MGGHIVWPHRFPWMVSLFIENGGKITRCGGTLISHREHAIRTKFVLTAAHCFMVNGVNSMENIVTVVIGAHNVSSNDDIKQVVNGIKVIKHDLFSSSGGIVNNIAIVILEKKVPFAPTVSPICLNFKTTLPPPNARCYVAGWGAQKMLGESSAVLRAVEMEIKNNSVCEIPATEGETMCVASRYPNDDPCFGDSGGPLMCTEDDVTFTQYAIVGHKNDCRGRKRPRQYTSVLAYKSWIKQVMKQYRWGMTSFTSCMQCLSGSE